MIASTKPLDNVCTDCTSFSKDSLVMLIMILYCVVAITFSMPLKTLAKKKFLRLGNTTPMVFVLPDFKLTASLLGL